MTWVNSSYSGAQHEDCVELAAQGHVAHVRDFKTPAGPRITLCPRAWKQFISASPKTPQVHIPMAISSNATPHSLSS
ncbi:DUF397 domain-containing protein [Streptomyces sp. CA-135486]|uniref:DUF397 domain-containing protein n=1 Tax=Streptomyces sp. CA-135486 TaxID=3240049 RepID=UPI003D91F7FE